MNKPSVLLRYDYFTPAYKAGGPIQSLHNLVSYLKNDFCFSVVTSAYDKGESTVLKDIKVNEWNIKDDSTKVFYWIPSFLKSGTLIKILSNQDYDIIYINGLYSPFFSIIPLLFCKQKIVLAPRGMLHAGALTQKSGKKKLFLTFFKLLNWHNKIIFHATDEAEKNFITKKFGSLVIVKVAPNIPKQLDKLPAITKIPGVLRLVSIALVSPMKNFELVLEALKLSAGNIEYTIYGPVIDKEYWKRCLKLIQEMPTNVKVVYKGGLDPGKVQGALQNNHIFILPSVSENFGHAIFESLSAGKPVITSNNTPWIELEEKKAGWNVGISNTDGLENVIKSLIKMEEQEYEEYCNGAFELAKKYMETSQFRKDYRELFSEE